MKKKLFWISWLLLSACLAGYFVWDLTVSEDKSLYLIGETTYGHYQIEMACETCHTDPFGGTDVLQNACVQCHAAELDEAQDSHPKSKFTDPREAYRLEILDARYCTTCHTEHKPHQTGTMGVTLPGDYCFHCHQEVINERESHQGLAFDSCASAGCHNFHDNRALYESFLLDHAGQPWVKAHSELTPPSNAFWQAFKRQVGATTSADSLIPLPMETEAVIPSGVEVPHDWMDSAHQQANLSCESCHQQKTADAWVDKPGLTQCQACHQDESEGFLAGKHGMRLSVNSSSEGGQLGAITPAESPLSFHDDALNIQHGCTSCHGAHSFDTSKAAVEACLDCHNDEHSLAYSASPHSLLWESEQNGDLPAGSGVTCATCHMPRLDAGKIGTSLANQFSATLDEGVSYRVGEDEDVHADTRVIRVQHNQNWNLRPNEKMIRPVCLNCHGLEFSIDALADEALIENNFSGKPGVHIESVDWAVERDKR